MALAQNIAPHMKKMGYVDARLTAKLHNSSLPSNVLHDDILLRSDKWIPLAKSGYYPAFADEISAHPSRGNVFRKGKDIVDSRTGWRLPISEAIATADKDFIGIPGIGLFVKPADVKMEMGKTIVHPESIIVYSPRIEVFGVEGRVREDIRMPLDIGQGNVDAKLQQNIDPLPSNGLRWSYCFEGETVTPIKRYDQDFRRGIFEIVWTPKEVASAGIVVQE